MEDITEHVANHITTVNKLLEPPPAMKLAISSAGKLAIHQVRLYLLLTLRFHNHRQMEGTSAWVVGKTRLLLVCSFCFPRCLTSCDWDRVRRFTTALQGLYQLQGPGLVWKASDANSISTT